MSSIMQRFISRFSVDIQVIKEGFQELMDNPIQFFASRPDDLKGYSVFILTVQIISLLLGPKFLGSFLVILVTFLSFIFSALTGIISKSLKEEAAKLSFIQIITNGTAKWIYIQYTISVSLASLTFISLILQIALATYSPIYLFTAVMSLLLFVLYGLEALASLQMDDGNSEERTHIQPADEAV